MRRLTVIVVVLAALWGAWWWVGATATERGLRAFLGRMEAEGWTVRYDGLDTRGFPSRFDTTADGLLLAAPNGPEVSLPFFQTLMLAYAPNRAIAVWPPEWRVGDVVVISDTMRASLALGASADLPLRRLTANAAPVAAEGAGWRASAAEMRAASEASPLARNGQHVGLLLSDLLLPAFAREVVDPSGRFPERVERLHLDAVVGFDRPWDRHTLLSPRLPQPTRLSLDSLSFEWGRLELNAEGALDMDAAGVPTGRVVLRLAGWEDLLALGEELGLVPPDYAPLVRQAMTVLDAMDGGADGIETALVFEGGRATLGPIPLGPAPRLRY
ncbi:hypothetical protein BCF33_1471 [Hasllibacter halocynthiae]|uniref:DUF2125 domain-containing protein n=1 Tax=Hasllibacter halocynthiae TaxID=595589 RepID=A0A2T0X109_9RHOB|nr:DUF2125 domain-containing protein [Hasllibacter halocynthiae]PRY92621.1 hypothetical protein BCF33_1471 [Hasllibacter halocynthiae]